MLFIFREKLREVVERMKNFWDHNDFEEAKKIRRLLKITQNVSDFIDKLFMIAILLGSALALIQREPIFRTWLPHDRSLLKTDVYYLVANVLFQLLAQFPGGYFGTTQCDLLGIALFVVAIGQFRLLQYALRDINKGNRSEDVKEELLKKYIDYHNNLYAFVDDVKEVFRYPILFQTVTSALLTCCSVYLSLTVNLKQFYLYVVCATVQLFCFCATAEMLKYESLLVSDALYNCGWEQHNDNKMRRSFTLIMQRSQKGLYFDVGGLVELSYKLFLNVLKMAISVYTLLNKTNELKK